MQMTDLRDRVEHALKHDIAPGLLLLDGNGIEVMEVPTASPRCASPASAPAAP